MKLNGKWKITVGIGAAALITGSVAGVAGAEPTAKSATFVDGFGDVTDDFNDHEREAGVLCDGCDNSHDTDLVILWQSILAADGFLITTVDDVDGDFGSATAAATVEWQAHFGLEPTGEVDQTTWADADDRLKGGSGDYATEVVYFGESSADERGDIVFTRVDGGDGGYELRNVQDPWGGWLENVNGAKRIELFEETIRLKAL